MRIFILVIILAGINYSCKSEKQSEEKVVETGKEDTSSQEQPAFFQDYLLDYREVENQFIDGYGIDGFGIERVNDSVFNFAFKLSDYVSDQIINQYSVGISGYDSNLSDPINASFSPELKQKDDGNYIILRQKIKNTKYFDSLRVYIYQRNNWEASGNLGQIMISDILFEN